MKLLLCAFLALGLAPAFGAESAQPAANDELPVPPPVPETPAQPAASPEELPADAAAETATLPPIAPGNDGRVSFYVIPVREQIGAPILYMVRKGVKEAIEAGAECVILDMHTPGGELGVTLEIMEVLGKFDGTTVTYVNSDAVSAGAFISAATDRIYLAPSGVIGAAAPVAGTGQDIDETMKQKVVSYLRARIRAISEDHPFRGDVVSAMIDENFELKIDDVVIKPKGELLSLTASEAMKTYGSPPRPLLGAGIATDLPELYGMLAGSAEHAVRKFQMTWSLDLALWLMRLSPLLLGLGGLLLMIEIYTPGFGWVGISGIILLLIVFFGHNVAGLSGHEPVLFFVLGVALVLVEILLFPGTLVFGALGGLVILGSLLWGMADIWPREVQGISPGMFLRPAYNLSLGVLIALALFLALARFLPKTTLWNRMVLAADIHGTATGEVATDLPTLEGTVGVVVSPLRPTGTIELEGQRYEARSEVGEIGVGTRVRVVRRADFVLIVEPMQG